MAPTATTSTHTPTDRLGHALGECPPAPAESRRGRHATLGHYVAFTFVHPRAALADLVADPRGRLFAALVLGAVAVLYSLVEWFLYRQDYDPVPPTFLRIPTDQYHAWATLLCVPAFLGG